jgi:hypothetical protein
MCKVALKFFLSQRKRGYEAMGFGRSAGVGGASLLALKASRISADDPKQEPIGFSVFFTSSSVCLMMNEIHKFDRDAGLRDWRWILRSQVLDLIAFRDP